MLTVENRADKNPCKIGLLVLVQRARDLWSVRVVGPWLFLRVGHDSDTEGRIEFEGGGFQDGEKTSEFDGRVGARVIKAQGNYIEWWRNSPDLGSKTSKHWKML